MLEFRPFVQPLKFEAFEAWRKNEARFRDWMFPWFRFFFFILRKYRSKQSRWYVEIHVIRLFFFEISNFFMLTQKDFFLTTELTRCEKIDWTFADARIPMIMWKIIKLHHFKPWLQAGHPSMYVYLVHVKKLNMWRMIYRS